MQFRRVINWILLKFPGLHNVDSSDSVRVSLVDCELACCMQKDAHYQRNTKTLEKTHKIKT